MKKEKQLLAIAEACPQLFKVGKSTFGLTQLYWLQDGKFQGMAVNPLSDLNAMHEAEKTRWSHKTFRGLFRHYLVSLVNNRLGEAFEPTQEEWEATIHATAAQRAEAFLRTIGKWEE